MHSLTPYPLIDEQKTINNIEKYQSYCDQHSIPFRPHIKTHKQIAMAKRQIDAGAIGINCQKISEAEVFVNAGFKDILLTYNIFGFERIKQLKELANKSSITVVVDSQYAVNELCKYDDVKFENLSVLVECDTGAGRCGVQSPAAASELAYYVAEQNGLTFQGLMTYPPSRKIELVDAWLREAKALCEQRGLSVATVTSGGTPDMWSADKYTIITEYRAGTYIYNDRSLMALGICDAYDCALTIQTTVVSRPTSDRAIIDAGSKSLSSDLLGLDGFGLVKAYPEARIYSLNEEHGIVDVSQCNPKPEVGDVLSIIPNHVCVISNLYDNAVVKKIDGSLKAAKIDARGTVF